MPLIVKPISANLTTDKDFLGKSVLFYSHVGSLLYHLRRELEAED